MSVSLEGVCEREGRGGGCTKPAGKPMVGVVGGDCALVRLEGPGRRAGALM